jgi:hypothetical protein
MKSSTNEHDKKVEWHKMRRAVVVDFIYQGCGISQIYIRGRPSM